MNLRELTLNGRMDDGPTELVKRAAVNVIAGIQTDSFVIILTLSAAFSAFLSHLQSLSLIERELIGEESSKWKHSDSITLTRSARLS